MRFRIREYDEEPADKPLVHHTEYFLSTTKDHKISSTTRTKSKPFFRTRNFTKVWSDLFLPIGYPHSVDPSYLPYQLYDGLQGLCSYWRGVVSTKAVLEASGVGNSNATAFGAAITWALRDGSGMIGGLLFSYICSSYFDTHVKVSDDCVSCSLWNPSVVQLHRIDGDCFKSYTSFCHLIIRSFGCLLISSTTWP